MRSRKKCGSLASRSVGRSNRRSAGRRETGSTFSQPHARNFHHVGDPIRHAVKFESTGGFRLGDPMPAGQTIRVRIAAPPAEARRLCTRLSRGGIPAALDDGSSPAEVLVAVRPEGDLEPYRSRANWLLVLGSPGAAYFAAGADDVVVPGEPELLFRRLRAALERLDLLGRVDRLNERVVALEAGLADAAHDVRSPLQVVIGNAELLARDSALTATQRECAEAAARQGLRALQLAERILEAAKQRSRAELEVEAVDVGELIEGAVDQAQLVARQRGVTIVAVPPARSLEIRAE